MFIVFGHWFVSLAGGNSVVTWGGEVICNWRLYRGSLARAGAMEFKRRQPVPRYMRKTLGTLNRFMERTFLWSKLLWSSQRIPIRTCECKRCLPTQMLTCLFLRFDHFSLLAVVCLVLSLYQEIFFLQAEIILSVP